MWYVIQTITGKETETADTIDRILEKRDYKKCFVIQQECIWRIEGRCQVHIEPLFPSYIFVETDTPNEFFLALKCVPKLTKLLGNNGMFGTVWEEEEKLLQKLMKSDSEYTIRRSLIRVDSEGKIISVEGPLKEFVGRIIKKRLRKRVVTVEIPLLGEIRHIQLGVRLVGDEE